LKKKERKKKEAACVLFAVSSLLGEYKTLGLGTWLSRRRKKT
jgi:hypothetical protein